MKEVIKLEPYKCFYENSNYYIFSSGKNRLLNLSKEQFDKLKGGEKEDFSIRIDTEKDQEFVAECTENQLLRVENSETYQDAEEINTLILMIEQSCNLNCTYCYGGGGEYNNKGKMSLATAKDAVDYLLRHCGNKEKVYIVFFGGEPLLNIQLIYDIVEYTEKVQEETGIYIGKSMTTNGTLLTEEIANYCQEKEINIKISIDGPEKINDSCRIYRNGTGSYEDIIKNTAQLREKGMISARATITPNCLDAEFIENSLRKLGFANVGSDLANELFSREDFLRVYRYYANGMEEIRSLIKDKKYNEIKERHIKFWGYLFLVHKSAKVPFHCGTGRTMYAVDINGDLYPCQRFVGHSDYKLGNISSDAYKRKEFLNKINIDNPDRANCKKCWVKSMCLGQCPYLSFISAPQTGNLEMICDLERALYEDAVRLYIQLSESEKMIMFQAKTV